MSIFTSLSALFCTIILITFVSSQESCAADIIGPVALADQYLMQYAESEGDAMEEFACVIIGQAFSAYDAPAQLVQREDLFLAARSKEKKLDYFCSATLLARHGEPIAKRMWDESLENAKRSYHRLGLDIDDTTTWKSSNDGARSIPRFSPFALAISTRMGWMAGKAKVGFLDSLCAVKSDIFRAELNSNGDLVGFWAVNSPGCVLKLTFGREVGNLPIASEWYVLPDSPDVESTMRNGVVESSSTISWTKIGETYVPTLVRKIDNGNQRTQMCEEWEIELEWKIGLNATDNFPEQLESDRRRYFMDFEILKGSEIAMHGDLQEQVK